MRIKVLYIMIVALGGFLNTTDLNAQEVKVADILEKATKFYTDQDQYRVEMKFTMYRGFNEAYKTEEYTGIMERNGNFMKNSVLDTKIYQFPEAKVIVDDETKTVTYSPNDKSLAQNVPVDLKVFLDYYKETQVLDMENEWVCEMVTTRKNFIETPYGKVVLHVSKEDHCITRQELFFSNRIPFKSKDGSDIEHDFGKLVIELAHKKNEMVEPRRLTDFVLTKGSNTIRLNEAYKAYRFINVTEENN